MIEEKENQKNENIVVEAMLCKSVSGTENEDGNYVFEVEASNENLDLQNQKTLQSALENSSAYFKSNGVISDDHMHKTRNPDGTVEMHKDKIIGEPLDVWFDKDTKKTYVKGILYSGIKAAKPYIDLLKNNSHLVKASIGGIMPKIKHNPDGTETVTSFMWNDLALTCSPVNWTVGSAKFAKSIAMADFCKSLEAGAGTNAAEMTGGRSLQTEEVENKTKELLDITDGNIKGDDKSDDLEKSDDDKSIIHAVVMAIDKGELKTFDKIKDFLVKKGFSENKAEETTKEIIKQGEQRMKKSHFSSTIDDLLKSYTVDEDIEKSKAKDSEENGTDESEDEGPDLFNDDEDDDDKDSESEKKVEKCSVKKSAADESYLDATELMKSMGEKLDALTEENESLRKSLEEIQENMINVTKSFGEYVNAPNGRQTVMQKSMGDEKTVSSGPVKRPSNADFDVLKSCLVKAVQNKKIGLEAVQFYNSEFQKAMAGQKINPDVWGKICSIVHENR